MPAPNEVAERDQATQEMQAAQSALSSTLSALITLNRVADARALLAAASEELLSSPELQKWAIVLAPPVARSVPRQPKTTDADFDWIRQHGADYVGRWVAIRAGELLADSDTLRELLEIADRTGGRSGVLFHKL